MNLFEFLTNNIRRSSTKCYGDLIEGREKNIKDSLKSMLTDKEYYELEEYSNNNKNRLLKECEITTNIKHKDLTNYNHSQYVSGIGHAQQIY